MIKLFFQGIKENKYELETIKFGNYIHIFIGINYLLVDVPTTNENQQQILDVLKINTKIIHISCFEENTANTKLIKMIIFLLKVNRTKKEKSNTYIYVNIYIYIIEEEKIKDYYCIRRLGGGAFATAYLALHHEVYIYIYIKYIFIYIIYIDIYNLYIFV